MVLRINFLFSAYKDSKKRSKSGIGKLFFNDHFSRVTPNYLKSPTKEA